MSKKTNRVLSLLLSMLLVLQLSFGTGIGGVQSVKARDNLTESQISQEENVDAGNEDAQTADADTQTVEDTVEQTAEPAEEDQPVEAAEEETAALKVKINGIEKDVTLLDTTVFYQNKTWTNAEVSYTYEEMGENANIVYLKSAEEGASFEAAKIYSSSTGFDGLFVQGADGWSSKNVCFKSLYPTAESATIYVIYTAADKTESYIKLQVKKTAQQGVAFLPQVNYRYSESTPGEFGYKDGSFYAMTGNPEFDYDSMAIYENGKAVSTTLTLPAYSTDTTAFAYKETNTSSGYKMAYLARPGRYWIKTTTEYNGQVYVAYLPVIGTLNYSSIGAYITQATNTMADEDYNKLPGELRAMLETAKTNLENGQSTASKLLYLDADGNPTQDSTCVAYYDRFGKQMDAGRLLENDATVVADMAAIAATYKTDASLAQQQLDAYKKIAAVNVEEITDPVAYREKVIAVKGAKYALLSTKSLEEINAILTGLGLDTNKEEGYADAATVTFGENPITDRKIASATLTYTASTAGKIYYLVQNVDTKAPDAAKVVANGKALDAAEGENTLSLTGLDTAAKKLYLVLKTDEVESALYTLDIAEANILKGLQLTTGSETFDANKEMTTSWETGDSSFRFKVLLNAASDKDSNVKLTFTYTNLSGEKTESSITATGYYTWFKEDFIALDGNGNDMTVTAERDGVTQTYQLHVTRKAYITAFTATDANYTKLTLTPTFNKSKTEYTASVLDNVRYLNLTATDPVEASYSDESKVLFNGTASEDGSYKWELTDAENVMVFKADNGADEAVEYKLTVTKIQSATLTINTSPADAQFSLYTSSNQRVWPNADGTFSLVPGDEYSYTVAKSGYVGQTDKITLTESATRDFTLEKAPEAEELPQLKADYPSFRSGSDNLSVVDAKTPITKESIELKWERQMGDYVSPSSGSTPIVVGNCLYTQSGGKIFMEDKETGATLKSAETVAQAGFNLIPMTYGGGMLFVPLSGGYVQCFNASTLESIWVYKDPMGGGVNSPIRYDDGYIYIGFQNSKANFVCISTTDEDPSSQDEQKVAIWRVEGNGYQWDGAWTNDKYVFVVDQTGRLICMDKKDGTMVQCIQTKASRVRSDVAYYNGRIYFSSQSGYLFSYNLTEDGKIDTENLIEPLYLGNNTTSTSTPAIYNNRLYIGISNGGNFGTEGYSILVVNIDQSSGALSVAYAVPTDGYCQTSGLIVNGYEKEDGYVYVYFLANSAHGTLYMIKDKAGLTEADPATGAFYTPNHEQYCIASAVADSDGNIYMKNDSAWQFTIKRAEAYIKEVELDGGNAVLDGGKDFAGSTADHTITVDAGIKSLKMRITPNDGVDVTINGTAGNSQEIQLSGSKTVVEVQLKKGDATRSYQFTIYEGPTLTSMSITNNPNEGMGKSYTLDPSFASEITDYTAGFATVEDSAYIWVNKLNSTDVLEAVAISGVEDMDEDPTLTIRTNYKGNIYIPVYLADGDNATVAEVQLTVKNADGTQQRVYNITIYTKDALPVLTVGDDAVTERTDTTAKLTYSTNKAGTLYYLVQDADDMAPDAEKLQKDGKSLTLEEAVDGQTLEVSEITRAHQTVYMLLKDADGRVSVIRTADLAQTFVKGDVNGDGTVNLSDVIALLNKVTAEEDTDLDVCDYNEDGTVNLSDVIALLNWVTEQE